MPIILCPKCQGKLRMPDDMEPRRVKCPTCDTVFMSDEASTASSTSKIQKRPSPPMTQKANIVETDFEIIDEEEEETPRSRSKREEPEPNRSRRNRDEDDEEDRPRSRRRDEEDRPKSRRRDEEDDRGSRRRRREEEEEDRPRSRRRRDEDDEYDDEEDDRRDRRRGSKGDSALRRRLSRREDDYEDDYGDDDDYQERKKSSASQWNSVKLGLQLNYIAGWIGAGAYGLMCFWVLLFWAQLSGFHFLTTIAGIAGLGHLIVAGVGFVFCMLGPNKNGMLGLGIATISLAGVHLILLFVLNEKVAGIGGFGLGSRSSFNLAVFSGTLPFLTFLGFGVVVGGGRGGGSGEVILILLPLVEVARLILFSLFLKAVAKTNKNRSGTSTASSYMVVWSSVSGGLVGLGVLMGVLIQSTKSVSLLEIMLPITTILSYGAACGMMCWLPLVIEEIRDGIRSKRR